MEQERKKNTWIAIVPDDGMKDMFWDRPNRQWTYQPSNWYIKQWLAKARGEKYNKDMERWSEIHNTFKFFGLDTYSSFILSKHLLIISDLLMIISSFIILQYFFSLFIKSCIFF